MEVRAEFGKFYDVEADAFLEALRKAKLIRQFCEWYRILHVVPHQEGQTTKRVMMLLSALFTVTADFAAARCAG